MLQLNDVCKSYTTGDFTQKALNNVSIAFRDSEFVAVLGPSGSGKTTMLNIIGGLDHYDSGDLQIDGVSTKEYKDRDWDAYRNNRVGFVFQSYNLIPHQTVIANVELALTLSGVSREERHARAEQMLKRVGLGEHMHKKPSQLSGGQMQRVAIARALINDPDILLADEPTGALDSKTSDQIMDLLSEIASDRLVVMVTHNPDLAERYATRIVHLSDGVIQSDSDPFIPAATDALTASAKPTRRTHMSFLTALSLSANNLRTKKGRTIMTAIAGSIGIIGIAAILALANGVNSYIKDVEEDTLSEYPVQVMSTGFDISAFMGNFSQDDSGDSSGSDGSASGDDSQQIGEAQMLSHTFASFGSNDLKSLKEFLDSEESHIYDYANSVEYSYDITPQIYDANTSSGVRQVNPDTSFSQLGMGSTSSDNSLVSVSMSTDVFSEMMSDAGIVEDQYDVVAGHWPENYHECVLVLTENGKISDHLAYLLGLRDSNQLKNMVKQLANNEKVVVDETAQSYSYDDIMNLRFKVVNAVDMYQYDEEYNVWVNKSDDEEYMKNLVDSSEDIVIAGIVKPKADSKATALSTGIYYSPDLIDHLMDVASSSEVVKQQLANPDVDVLSGKTFDEEAEGSGELDMNSLFTIDSDALSAAFTFDANALDMSGFDTSNIDMSSMDMPDMDLSQISIDTSTLPTLTQDDLANLFPELSDDAITQIVAGLDVHFTDDGQTFDAAMRNIMQGYYTWSLTNPGGSMSDYFNTPEVQMQLSAAASTVDTDDLQNQIVAAVAARLGTTSDNVDDVVSQRIADAYAERVGAALQEQITASMESYLSTVMQAYMTQISDMLQQQIADSMTQYTEQLSNAMEVDEEAFANAFQFNMDSTQLSELLASMMSTDTASYESNLKKLGYADPAKPSMISIYARDFDSKAGVISVLDGYNERMQQEDPDKMVTYSDIVGSLMSSITEIIDMITRVLIAFVAISLVVSSIMIGVITYISVLERIKEIGILRSIGASKRDIGHVFNAETIIEGLIAGVLGVGVTALVCIPVNIIVNNLYDVPQVAILPVSAGVALIAISVALTFIAGLIPSRSASKKDPVEALRSE